MFVATYFLDGWQINIKSLELDTRGEAGENLSLKF